jgi:hypothetical protein
MMVAGLKLIAMLGGLDSSIMAQPFHLFIWLTGQGKNVLYMLMKHGPEDREPN